MNKKLKFIFKDKKNYKSILYLLLLIVSSFTIYSLIPKFFNYTPKLVQESLKINSNINIKQISNISYKFFPSPRLRLSGVDLEFGEGVLVAENTEVDIILKLSKIINYKSLDYNKFLLRNGSSSIEINKVNKLFNYIRNNKKKINFKNNTFILLNENKKILEINDSLIKFNTKNNFQQLNINGLFLNHKISFILKDKNDSKINIALKVPELDILANILLKKIDDFKTFEGKINFQILNNFFQFNLIKDKNILINKGFVRSNLINSSFEGDVSFKPYFYFILDFEPSLIDVEKLNLIIKQNLFSENYDLMNIIKKLDGSLNFKNKFNGRVIFKNREISLESFQLDKEKKISLNAQIYEFGKKGRIQFNLTNDVKKISISGFLTPSSSKIKFDEIVFKKKVFKKNELKEYEEKFENEIINGSIVNIFNKIKINNFFKNF
jgi:hypothetical protein